MSTETQQQTPLSEEELTILARDYVLAMMRSASTDKVPPREWWEQAKAALEIGAEEPTLEGMTASIARRLQIESLTKHTASWISSHEQEIRAHFPRFRSQCKRVAVYIVGMARIERDAQRNAVREEKADE